MQLIADEKLLDTLYDKEAKPPADHKDNHFFFSRLSVSEGFQSMQGFYEFLYEDYVATRKGEKAKFLAKYHLDSMLLNLAQAAVFRRWVLVPLDRSAYQRDEQLSQSRFTYAYMSQLVELLEQVGVIEKRKGAKFEGAPTRTRLFPGREIQQNLIHLALAVEQAIEPPYTFLRDGNNLTDLSKKLKKSHPDIKDLVTINDFLRSHTWACKGAIRMIFKGDAFTSGRLVTPFQNLPDKKHRIRINTLINGERIAEADFNANHLRLNLAVIAGEDAGPSPYEDICELAGNIHRDIVKKCITYAMGADERNKALAAFCLHGYTKKTFTKIETAALKRFPKLVLFKGFGVQAQNLEGQILKDVLLAGVKEDIVALPVHDAVAVQSQHIDWAIDQMTQAWNKYADSGGKGIRTVVKVDKA